jgi:replicative superfamily II helicase
MFYLAHLQVPSQAPSHPTLFVVSYASVVTDGLCIMQRWNAGSGKTISSELTMLRVFLHYPKEKILYVAPLKALVRERIKDWGKGLCKALNKHMVELTGDYTPDVAALMAADIIICTPEKWDGISRNWQARSYVQWVRLVVMDEIHLLGSERGPTLEVIVSRMRYISTITRRPVRFVGLSTALANAHDLASWLGVEPSVCFLSITQLILFGLTRMLSSLIYCTVFD